MKKNIIKTILFIFVIFIISTLVVVLKGKTYTAKFNISNDAYELNIENRELIEILEENKTDNEYLVTFKGKKPGKVYMTLQYDEDATEMQVFYIHKSMVITYNSFFGYSVGSKIVPICISALLIFIVSLFIREYRKSIKESLYQYKNVSYLGIIIFLISFTINNILSIFNYYGISDTIDKVISSVRFFSFFLIPVAVISFILAIISNIVLIIREGKSLRNFFALFFSIFICVFSFLPNIVYGILFQSQSIDIYNLNSPGPYIYNFIESFVYLVVAYLECVLIGTIVIALKSTKKKVKHDKDYIIILGCKIRKDGGLTPLLKGRVDRALKFRNEQVKETGKDLIFIPSGGKGNDEVISEALAMKNYLVDSGIKENSILIEDKSTNTFENIKFSNKLIKKKNANIAYSTTNYHVFRAGLIANELGLKAEGIGSKTKIYYWVNAFMREFIGTLYSEKKRHFIVFSIIMIILAIMILITYYSNVL